MCAGNDTIPREQDGARRDLPVAAQMNKPVGLNELAVTVREVLSVML